MYISTFEFKKAKLLRNRDLVHKLVMLMFDGNRADENVLYMVMDSKKDGVENAPIHMIVQSNNQPKNIPNDSLRLLNSKECSNGIDAIKNGDVVRLYGVFEPQKRNRKMIKNPNGMWLLRTPKERVEWLQKKFESAGNLVAINEITKSNVYISKTTGESHHTSFYGYECLIKVADSEKLKEMLKNGVGRSRSYGAGLCLVLGVQHV